MKKQKFKDEEKLKEKIKELEENSEMQQEKIKRLDRNSKLQNWINLFLWFNE